MYIRRKVFSILTDEMGEERLYSVNETVFEGYEEREFAKKEEEEEKVSLKDVKSKRGIGRGSAFTGIIPLYVSRKAAKKAANKADEEGASDVVIVEKAKSAGTKAGAATGAVLGAASGGYAIKNYKKSLKDVSDLIGRDKSHLSVGKRKLLVGARKALKNKKVVGGIVAASALAGATGAAIGGRLSADKMTRSRLVKRHNLEQEKKNKKEDK